MPPQIHGSILSLSGSCFDAVVGLCVPLDDAIHSRSIQPVLGICLSLDVRYAATGQVREEVLWRTCIADFYQTRPAPGNLATAFRNFIRYNVASKMTRLLEDDLIQIEPTLVALESLTKSSGRLDILPSREIVDTATRLQEYEVSQLEWANDKGNPAPILIEHNFGPQKAFSA
jgi:hypothetical protein